MGATPLGRGPATISLIVIESVGIVRASLRLVFAADPDLMLLGEAEDADAGLELVASLRGQGLRLALVGLELGGDHDSFWLIRSLRERSPELIILATGADLHRGAISQGLFVGADGFVHKNSSPERFVEATRRAAAGEVVLEGLPRGALGGIVEGVESMERQRATTPILTDREKAVLVAAADGLTARDRPTSRGERAHGDDPPQPHLPQAEREQPGRRIVGGLASRLDRDAGRRCGGARRRTGARARARRGTGVVPPALIGSTNSDGGASAYRPCSPHDRVDGC